MKDGALMVVEAYGSSDWLRHARMVVRLTSVLLYASLIAVSIGGWLRFLSSGMLADEKKVDSTRARSSVKSDLFNEGSTALVCLTSFALCSNSASTSPNKSTAGTTWLGILSVSRQLALE
jgi:hypothetical protein